MGKNGNGNGNGNGNAAIWILVIFFFLIIIIGAGCGIGFGCRRGEGYKGSKPHGQECVYDASLEDCDADQGLHCISSPGPVSWKCDCLNSANSYWSPGPGCSKPKGCMDLWNVYNEDVPQNCIGTSVAGAQWVDPQQYSQDGKGTIKCFGTKEGTGQTSTSKHFYNGGKRGCINQYPPPS